MTGDQKQRVRDAAVDGRLACAKAFRLSEDLDLSLKVIGEFCNEDGIRIAHCQLGCFP